MSRFHIRTAVKECQDFILRRWYQNYERLNIPVFTLCVWHRDGTDDATAHPRQIFANRDEGWLTTAQWIGLPLIEEEIKLGKRIVDLKLKPSVQGSFGSRWLHEACQWCAWNWAKRKWRRCCMQQGRGIASAKVPPISRRTQTLPFPVSVMRTPQDEVDSRLLKHKVCNEQKSAVWSSNLLLTYKLLRTQYTESGQEWHASLVFWTKLIVVKFALLNSTMPIDMQNMNLHGRNVTLESGKERSKAIYQRTIYLRTVMNRRASNRTWQFVKILRGPARSILQK